MAIKEEQYDPGYEDAYGGAYAERGPEEGPAQSQTNGHCTFSTGENTGNTHTPLKLSVFHSLHFLKSVLKLNIVMIRVQHDVICLDAYFNHEFLLSCDWSSQHGYVNLSNHVTAGFLH